MKLKNPFKDVVRNLYLYQYNCQDCGRSDRGLELHHIIGRKSNSKLNAIVLCLDCHKKCGHSREEEKKYAQITIRFHLREKNKLEKEDIEFYQDNMLLYQV
jgi:hypothetical protein